MSKVETCRACKSKNVFLFLEMGSQPPANQFLSEQQLKEDEASFPLNAYVCLDCALIQVADFIPADFFRHYVYVPSASATMHSHFAGFAREVMENQITGTDSLVVDIGSNDGLFLSACNDIGMKTLGIEPAANLTEIARGKGVEVINEYFSPDTASSVRWSHGPAAVITTTNTFNHIDDLHGFMAGVRILLDDDGVFIVEVPQALDLVAKNEFDTIYHEHLSEFSVTSLRDLYQFFDMEIADIHDLPVHGGSMRVIARNRNSGVSCKPVVAEYLQKEQDSALFEKQTYENFADRVAGIREELMTLLRDLKSKGNSIAGYGAPAKGNSLLNYYGIGPELLDFLADRNELKQGSYSPGMHIPVVSPDRILEVQPDYLLVLAWNFADEIFQQQEEYRNRGGRFILPIPEPRIVE